MEKIRKSNTVGFEDGGRAMSQGMRVTSRSWRREGNSFFLQTLQKELSPAHMTSARRNPFQTSDLQNYKISLCCAKPQPVVIYNSSSRNEDK